MNMTDSNASLARREVSPRRFQRLVFGETFGGLYEKYFVTGICFRDCFHDIDFPEKKKVKNI